MSRATSTAETSTNESGEQAGRRGQAFPRERFTRSLQKMFKRLDDLGRREIDVEYELYPYGPIIRGKVRAWPTRVSAFGSYAGGTMECGDLDLIIDIHAEWMGEPSRKGVPPPHTDVLKREFFAPFGHVHMMSSERYKLLELGSIDEALLLWEPGGDWQKRLDSVEVKQDARRFSRKHDALPVRLEQLNLNVTEANALVDAAESGVLTIDFIPMAKRLSPTDEELTVAEGGLLEMAATMAGKKTLELLPGFLVSTRKERSLAPIEPWNLREKTVLTGRPWFNIDTLSSPLVHTLYVVPQWSQRGPNGSMLIRRGRKHPQKLEFENCLAFTVGNGLVKRKGHRPGFDDGPVRSLHTTRRAATEAAGYEGKSGATIVEHKGAEVLEQLLGIFAASVDGRIFKLFDADGHDAQSGERSWLSNLCDLTKARGVGG
jgi:hypothetical protein